MTTITAHDDARAAFQGAVAAVEVARARMEDERAFSAPGRAQYERARVALEEAQREYKAAEAAFNAATLAHPAMLAMVLETSLAEGRLSPIIRAHLTDPSGAPSPSAWVSPTLLAAIWEVEARDITFDARRVLADLADLWRAEA